MEYRELKAWRKRLLLNAGGLSGVGLSSVKTALQLVDSAARKEAGNISLLLSYVNF